MYIDEHAFDVAERHPHYVDYERQYPWIAELPIQIVIRFYQDHMAKLLEAAANEAFEDENWEDGE